MNKKWISFCLGLSLSASPVLFAHEGHESHKGTEKGQKVSLQGEVVDMACYMGHEAKGAQHKDCSEMCVKGGMPMGLLTKDGTVYLLLEDHSSREPYQSLKGLAAEQVKVSGDLHKRGGLQAVTVEKAQKAS